MLALYIITGVFLLVMLLFYIPIHIKISYMDKLEVVAQYLFFHYTLEPEKKDKKNQDQSESKTEHQIKDIKDTVGSSWETIKSIKAKFGHMLHHIKVKPFRVRLGVTGQDAADTAIKYGEACIIVYPIISYIGQHVNITEYDVNIYADFDNKDITFEFFAIFRFLPIHIPHVFFKSISDYSLRILNKNKKKDGASK